MATLLSPLQAWSPCHDRLSSSEAAGTSTSDLLSVATAGSRKQHTRKRQGVKKTVKQGDIAVPKKTERRRSANTRVDRAGPPAVRKCHKTNRNDGEQGSRTRPSSESERNGDSLQALQILDEWQGFDFNLHLKRLALAGFATALVASTSSMPVLAETLLDVGQTAQQESVSLGSADLAAGLEAQIRRDLRTDLELAVGPAHGSDGITSLLELAERSAEIDSRLPPDEDFDASPGSLRNRDTGIDLVAASLPSAIGLAVSGSAAVASSAAGAAAGVLQPAAAAMVSPTAGLGAKLTVILTQAVQHFTGGGVAGAIGATVVYPLDTVKTKMQAQRKEEGDEGEPVYKNDLDCLVKMVKEEGVGSLYSGLGPQLLGVAPEKATKLTVNELLLSILEVFLPGARIWNLELIAGGGGGFAQVVFTNPVETVKVKLQTQTQTAGVSQKNTLQVVQELGFKGLYHGSTAIMARDVPGSAVFFAMYAFLKQVNPDQFFINGCIAAIPAAIMVTPADVIKTRLTVEPRPGQEPYKGPWDCAKRVVKEEGVGALFKGWGSRVLRISPQFGITLGIYDYLSH